MKFILILQAVLELLPAVLKAIAALEEALPDSGKGKFKLDIIKATVEAVYEKGTNVVGNFADIWPVLENVIGKVVGIYNALGVFKK